ncbi:MAG TPA: S24/S26 family peptidase [Candidatus Acidoferrales bacterium]|nr:S24/S26 family peptidase [Candidatus Acidoferrales bacterium]
MIPAIWPGDLLHVEAVRIGKLSAGDVILFRRGSRLFAHRLLATPADSDGSCVSTKGDALPSVDPPSSTREILGRVASIVAEGNRGKRKLSRALPNPALALAIASCDIIPAGMLRIRRFARLIRWRTPL